MKPAALLLTGGTAIFAAVSGWELRSQWLAETVDMFAPLTRGRVLPSKNFTAFTPENCSGYRRVRSSEGGRQQIYVNGKDVVSIFLPTSTGAEIAAAPGWTTHHDHDGNLYFTLIGEDRHCAVAFIHESQPVVMVSRLKHGTLIELAEKLKRIMHQRG